MSASLFTLVVAAVPAFLASVVEWVEAFTIVLAVGNTRGWRSPIWGTVGGLATLAVIVGIFGTPLIVYQEEVKQSFHIVVGILLLLFGMRWLRKACSSIVLRKRMNSWWRWRMTPCGVSSAGVLALDGYAPAVKEGWLGSVRIGIMDLSGTGLSC